MNGCIEAAESDRKQGKWVGMDNQRKIAVSTSNSFSKGIEELAEELASRWAPTFASKSWSERLSLLHQFHEQLLEDVADLDTYTAVSPIFIRKLIWRLSGGKIESEAQAHIYANSDDEEHRRAAGAWLTTRQRNPSIVGT